MIQGHSMTDILEILENKCKLRVDFEDKTLNASYESKLRINSIIIWTLLVAIQLQSFFYTGISSTSGYTTGFVKHTVNISESG